MMHHASVEQQEAAVYGSGRCSDQQTTCSVQLQHACATRVAAALERLHVSCLRSCNSWDHLSARLTFAPLPCLPHLCRKSMMRVRLADGTEREYPVITAHACHGHVMICKLNHGLDHAWVTGFQKQQGIIKDFLADAGVAEESLLSEQQQQQLDSLLGEGL